MKSIIKIEFWDLLSYMFIFKNKDGIIASGKKGYTDSLCDAVTIQLNYLLLSGVVKCLLNTVW